MLESNLEIQLVARNAVDELDADFRAFVLGVRDSPSGRYIVTGFSEKFGDAMCDLDLENYYVLRLVWTLDETQSTLEDEVFDKSPESQNHAFQMIQEVIEAEGDTLTREQKDIGMAGPKRLEVEILHGGIIFPSAAAARGVVEKKKIVVTNYLPPSGAFSHTLQGRVYSPVAKLLGNVTESFHSSEWVIATIERHLGNNTSSYSHIHRDQQEEAWKRIREFLAVTMTATEVEDLHKWDPPVVEVDYWDYSGSVGNYYSRTPSVYTPIVAEFRVSGDEIGAKIHLEQMECLVQSDSRTIEEVLAEVSHKKEDNEEEKSSSAGRSGSYGGFLCLDCQLPNCNGCQGSFDEAAQALPYLGPGEHLMH